MAFISYSNMEDIFNPNVTITLTESKKTLMSAMISPLLLNIMDRTLTIPANFTLKHIKVCIIQWQIAHHLNKFGYFILILSSVGKELGPEAIMSCMEWRNRRWSKCRIKNSNRTHTVCSCDEINNFALISETDMCRVRYLCLCIMYNI